MSIRINRRNIAVLLLCAMVGVCLLSGAYMMTHSGHIHDRCGKNGNCGTCERILAAAQSMKQLCVLVLFIGAALCAKLQTHPVARRHEHHICPPTLVAQKVQLNN